MNKRIKIQRCKQLITMLNKRHQDIYLAKHNYDTRTFLKALKEVKKESGLSENDSSGLNNSEFKTALEILEKNE